MNHIHRIIAAGVLGCAASAAHAVPITVVNHSFEADAPTVNEFYFGDPFGWSLLDPGGIIDGGLDVQGTLDVDFDPTPGYFGGVAPDGDQVALLFIGTDVGTSEVGLAQVLGTDLAANTSYSLAVDVGNINSGFASNGAFFDLSGFPGFRIELLAGGVVLATAAGGIDALAPDGTLIDEGEFHTVMLDFVTGAAHAQLGTALEIRLYNPNVTDPVHPGVDLEVDFDNVRLDASTVRAVPEPATWWLLAATLAPVLARRRRR